MQADGDVKRVLGDASLHSCCQALHQHNSIQNFESHLPEASSMIKNSPGGCLQIRNGNAAQLF